MKKNSEGDVIKHKARFMTKEYVQRQGVDFEEVFVYVARLDTVRLIFALATQHGWVVHHWDIKSTFLKGELQEEVHVAQRKGFVIKAEEHKVYKLSKTLYGLWQAPSTWNICLDKSLKSLNFMKSRKNMQCT